MKNRIFAILLFCALILPLRCILTVPAEAEETEASVVVSWEMEDAVVPIVTEYHWDPDNLCYVREAVSQPTVKLENAAPAKVKILLQTGGGQNVHYTVSFTEADGITTQVESDSPSSGTLTAENTSAVFESKIHITGVTASSVQTTNRVKIGIYTVSLHAEDTPILKVTPVEEEPCEEQPEEIPSENVPEVPAEDPPEEEQPEETPTEEVPTEEEAPAEEPAEEKVPEEKPPSQESASEETEEEKNPQNPEERELRIF